MQQYGNSVMFELITSIKSVLLHFVMGSITVGINVIYACCNVDVTKDCMFGEKLSQIPVPLTRGHLQCRDTCLDGQVSLQDRFYCSMKHYQFALYLGTVRQMSHGRRMAILPTRYDYRRWKDAFVSN